MLRLRGFPNHQKLDQDGARCGQGEVQELEEGVQGSGQEKKAQLPDASLLLARCPCMADLQLIVCDPMMTEKGTDKTPHRGFPDASLLLARCPCTADLQLIVCSHDD